MSEVRRYLGRVELQIFCVGCKDFIAVGEFQNGFVVSMKVGHVHKTGKSDWIFEDKAKPGAERTTHKTYIDPEEVFRDFRSSFFDDLRNAEIRKTMPPKQPPPGTAIFIDGNKRRFFLWPPGAPMRTATRVYF